MTSMESIESLLLREGAYVSVVVGHSMEPMLKERVDTIMVTPFKGRLKKYDVALYRVGEKYVLHRVVRVLPDSYVMCGDNCVVLEKNITDAEVLGKLERVWRGEEEYDLGGFGYKLYSRYKVLEFPFRKLYRRLRGGIGSRLRKLFGRNK
jgi:signal peptidase I